jgi:Ankyrin repeats (3 copies)
LHCACRYNQSESVVLKLIDLFPYAIQYKDSINHWYPLYYACRFNQSESVVLKLIELFPETIHAERDYYWYVLKWATRNKYSDCLIAMLSSFFPPGAVELLNRYYGIP